MRVHLVVKSIWDDWVISRLTRYLVEGLGWTFSKRPSPDADVNVFFPYLEWRFKKWGQTKTAAWFTHKRESEWGQKVWKSTAKAIDLCVTPAAMYVDDLAQYGDAVQIPHPVDLKHFTIEGARAFRHPDKFVIGVSGTVYPNDPRKGEGLVEQLIHDGYTVVGSGKGWPCPTHWYTWEEMPLYYRSLDCYLVTSTVEGGPVTVLEALACGVQVVLPKGVGQCDEYGASSYIQRYKTGGIALGLLDAEFCQSSFTPSEPRAVAEQYPISRWCREWKTVIEGAFG